MFKLVSPKVEFPKLEEEILTYWKKNKIFEKSIESRPADKTWTFLDGPPFVTGLPHYGSLSSSIPKDIFGRFWTMKGFRVRRVWGWDGHGLPIENKVENKLGITRKKDIEEKVGIKKFIEECFGYVQQVSGEWEWYIDHSGRWVDFKNAYKTWDLSYMESVMWVFKQMYDKKYIYKGLRVSLYCPHCATPISNFEVAMDADNYKEMQDPYTTYKYKLEGESNTYILAWSTTPWNKIVTPALAINPKLTYVKVKQDNEHYILAKSTLKMLRAAQHDIISEFKGADLVGKKFVPHYDYYKNNIKPDEKAFEIIGEDFVTADEGTGVVTIAAYGEEDLKAMKKHNIHIEMHLDEEGTIKPDVPLFGGMYYLKSNKFVNEDLEKRGLVYINKEYSHSVPLCWRCHTRLYYAPQNAWYVDVQSLKPKLFKNNELINWFPTHFKYGRFAKSMEAAPDWCISRSRYWGSPVPVWECRKCEERIVPGSIAQLEKLSGKKITNLHRPDIDEVTIPCLKCGDQMKRVPEVLDSWIEAGSASFAERHFPFNKSEKLEDFFPPDFIVEYTGQIRAWFYVLHVIATALYDSIAFKNVLVYGVILGTDGRKMSKNFGNYPDPKEMLQKYGGDALRLYLMSSPVMNGEDIIISEEQYRNQVKGMMLILWNVYNFFVNYANSDQWDFRNEPMIVEESKHDLDKWILSRLNILVRDGSLDLENYDTVSYISKLQKFIDDLSRFYIRASRDRVRPYVEDIADKYAFYSTCHRVLLTLSKLLAPITPFLAEEIYRNLSHRESVHLEDWPNVEISLIDEKTEEKIFHAKEILERVFAERKEDNIPLRQPLTSLATVSPVNFTEGIEKIIRQQANVINYTNKVDSSIKTSKIVSFKKDIDDALRAKGEANKLIRQIQDERKRLGTKLYEEVNVVLSGWPKEFEEDIKKKALIQTLTKGNEFKVTRI